ncbi:CdiA C-terminal domain-containing protein [Paenibacillus kobensis]|uniref:CdiA C-terminal domain-containing protein n=1 Tax=Paenibacillus kobensis TaxID=59841 RepID=UPI001C3FD82B|nr:hypothetical protein [Paenibacillus kobensis]
MVIDNDVFDAKMSGTQNGATVKVDSFVSDEVKSKGKVVETAKAAVITQVTTPYETLRNTAVAFDVSSHKTLENIKTSDVPNLNEPGSGLYYSQPKSLLIGLALTDGDALNDHEIKALHLRYDNFEVQRFNMMSMMANQYGAYILNTEFQHNINSGFNNYAATGISFRPKVGKEVTAPLEPADTSKSNINGKNGKGTGNSSGNASSNGKTTPSSSSDSASKPSGTKTKVNYNDPDKDNIRALERENEAAEILAKNGYKVEQNPNVPNTTKNPDYKIEGKIFDCYSPKPTTSPRKYKFKYTG